MSGENAKASTESLNGAKALAKNHYERHCRQSRDLHRVFLSWALKRNRVKRQKDRVEGKSRSVSYPRFHKARIFEKQMGNFYSEA